MSDIIDINVGQTTEEVTINVVDNVIQVNINKVTGGGGGAVSSVNNQTGDVVLNQDNILDGTTYKQYSLTEKNKLAGIEAGAEVNVNADWNATSGDAQILNKPTIPDVSTLVPYTGANQNVNLGEYELKAGQVTLDTTPTGTASVATTRWNDTIGSSETTLKGGNVILKNGIDLVARVVNKVTPNTTLTKAAYQVVRISGAQGQRLAVQLAQANNDNNSADTLGVVIETIAANQEGFIMTLGQIDGINTTGSLQGETWSDGDVLYLSPTIAGRITNIKPTGATGHIVIIGYVEYAHSQNGKIYVKIMNGWELDELHNVAITSVADKQLLSYDNATSLWKNKSVTTADIADSTNKRYVTDANLTTIGNQSGTNTGDETTSTIKSKLGAASTSTDGYLTSTDWNTFNGKQSALVSGTNIKTVNSNSLLGSGDISVGTVTSVSALTLGTTGTDLSSSVATGTTTPVITLNVPTASATNRGVLSSSDWTTFNNKQSALGYTPYRFIQTSQTAHTGTTAETILATATINGGTFNSGDIMKMFFAINKTLTNGTYAIRIRINTSNTLSGATQIALFSTGATTAQYTFITRNFSLNGGNLIGYNFTNSSTTDTLNTGGAVSSTTYNTANTLYVFFTVALANASDTISFNSCNITN